VFSGRGLPYELIHRQEESYRRHGPLGGGGGGEGRGGEELLRKRNRDDVAVQKTVTLHCLISSVVELGPLPGNITWSYQSH